jgi:hypothetical protein
VSEHGHDGLPHLPDLTDVDVIERTLIPALEAWIAGADRHSDAWATRLAVLVAVHNRLFALKQGGTIRDAVDDLAAAIDQLTARVDARDGR